MRRISRPHSEATDQVLEPQEQRTALSGGRYEVRIDECTIGNKNKTFSDSLHARSFRDRSITKHFVGLREDNQKLLSEREKLRRLLQEREEDVKLMRSQLNREKVAGGGGGSGAKREQMEKQKRARETGNMVEKLEMLQTKYSSLKQDLQSLLDEKEDLVQERDAYKCKLHRLNHSMSALLKTDGYKAIDLDWIISENRYLVDSLKNVKEEKQLANEMGKRYKAALEKTKSAQILRHGSTSSNSSEGGPKVLVDRIVQLIGQMSFPCPAGLDLRSADSLRELCLALLETLDDRMTQLKHQRRANKHILSRYSVVKFEFKSCKCNSLLQAKRVRVSHPVPRQRRPHPAAERAAATRLHGRRRRRTRRRRRRPLWPRGHG
jgi:hypothetical protein